MSDTVTAPAVGANSEVGVLRTVLVHRPDLAHERLSPSNCHELLFDDVIWVRRARQEHDAFVDTMREAGVEVLLLHDLLTETLADPAAREWLLSRRLRPENVTAVFSQELTAWMTEMPADELATRLTGGVTAAELPGEMARSCSARCGRTTSSSRRSRTICSRATRARGSTAASRSTRCTGRRARRRRSTSRPSTATTRASRPPTSRSGSAGPTTTGATRRWKAATSCRSVTASSSSGRESARTRAAVSILAQNLFAAGAARLVIGAQMPQERAAMHLDTVFTFCNRNVVTIYEPVVSQILPILYRPDGEGGVHAELSERTFLEEVQDALGLESLTVVTTGGDEFEAERNQWDDGNNVVALAPGVIVAYERNEATNFKLEKAGVEVHAIQGNELGRAAAAVTA